MLELQLPYKMLLGTCYRGNNNALFILQYPTLRIYVHKDLFGQEALNWLPSFIFFNSSSMGGVIMKNNQNLRMKYLLSLKVRKFS
jgi:hypothetical protein